MDELDEALQARFTDHVDTAYRMFDALQPQLVRVVEAIRDALVDEHRVIVCGTGIGASLAQMFATSMLARMRMERPGLPVVLLGNDASVLGAITESYGLANSLARQLQALAHAGDIVMLVCGTASAVNTAAVRAAVARDARVVSLSGEAGMDGGQPMPPHIDLRVPSDEPARVAECQLLVLNCIAEFVERRLFGSD